MKKGRRKMMINVALLSTLVGIPLTFLFGSLTPLLTVLLVMIGLDLFTGIVKGFYNKELRSRSMAQGMTRKAMIFVVLIMGHLIDMAMFAGLPVASSAVTCFYIGMEGLSILENLGQMDVPLPSLIHKYLLVLKAKGDETPELKQEDLPHNVKMFPVDKDKDKKDKDAM